MLFHKPKYADWLEEATFDNCKLNRKDFGDFLSNYLIGENDGFVLNLNGSWGTGKTEFCKRLYSNFITKGHPTIYINSWESDFSKEPLTVVSAELLRQMEALHSDIVGLQTTEHIKKVLGKTLKSLAVGVAGGISYKLIGESSAGVAIAQQLVQQDTPPEKFIDDLTENYSEQVESIKLIRESLTELAKALEDEISAKLPVIVIIDELDRCRPNYAIEMLEVIKHFFSTEKFVFVVATDTEQLCQSIKNIYGNDFNSNQYLKRFFDRTASLPAPNINEYINALQFNYSTTTNLKLYPNTSDDDHQFITNTLSSLAYAFDLKIRDIDQILNKLLSCLRTANSAKKPVEITTAINLPVLICGLIEYEINCPSYNSRTNNNKSIPLVQDKYPEEPISYLIELCFHSLGEKIISHHQLKSYTPSSKNHRIIEIMNHIHSINNDYYKIWRWSDYKKMIEMAGYLN